MTIPLKYLSVQQMQELSRHWSEPGEVRALLESIPQVRGILPDIEKAGGGLLQYTPTPQLPQDLAKLRGRTTEADNIHDPLLRGCHRGLTMQADFAETPEEALSWLTLRDTLLPDGLDGTRRSYREEAGAAVLLEKALTDEVKATLKNIPVKHNATMLDKFLALIASGKELGQLEDLKDEALKNAPSQGPTDAEVRQSRLNWIKAARALEQNLGLANPGKEIVSKVLGQLQQASKISLQRQEKKPKTPPAPTPENPEKK